MKIHYLQIHDGSALSVNQRKCMASVQRIANETDSEYELISIPKQASLIDALTYSNKVRMEKARTIPNLCYVDTDCLLVKPFQPEGDKPWFVRNEYGMEHDVIDIFYFFVNGNTDWFNFYMPEEKVEQGYALGNIMVSSNLKQLIDFGFIPSEYFLHLYSSSTKIIDNRGKQEQVEKILNACHKRFTEASALTIKLAELANG